jgi:hypothetical protein
MRSKEKIDVYVKPMAAYDNKKWFFVRVKRGNEFSPSFEDVFRVVRALIHCEAVKYEGKVKEPRNMVLRFFERCVEYAESPYEESWQALREEFKIPDRDREDEIPF